MVRHLPNAITCANLFSGCIGVVYAFNGDLKTAAWFVLASGIFDFFDGFAARLLKAYSNIGKDLDSLADVVSFGFLPGVIFYQLLNQSDYTNAYIPYLGFIVTIFSALRLAKFNNDARQTTDFIGLNTPMNTFVVISLPFIADEYPSLIYSTYFLLVSIAFLSYLLISELKLFSLKVGDLSWKLNRFKYIFLLITLVLIVVLKFNAVPFILLLYMVASYLHFNKSTS